MRKNVAVIFFFSPAESDLDDPSRDIQSPEPELLYYRGSEDQESFEQRADGNTEEMTATSWDASGAQSWYKMFRCSDVQMPYSFQPHRWELLAGCTCDTRSELTLLCYWSLLVLPRPGHTPVIHCLYQWFVLPRQLRWLWANTSVIITQIALKSEQPHHIVLRLIQHQQQRVRRSPDVRQHACPSSDDYHGLWHVSDTLIFFFCFFRAWLVLCSRPSK